MKKSLILSLTTVLVATAIAFPSTALAETKTNPYGTSTVDPAGPNEIILTISKGSKKVTFTTSSLAKIKTQSISLYEPFLKKRQKFSAISFKTLFAMAGISGGDVVVTKALNDYIFKTTASKFLKADALLAVKLEGSAISYDQGGPIRIIYPDSSPWSSYLDAWNWSIASISVK